MMSLTTSLSALIADTSTTEEPGGSFLFTLLFMALIGGAAA